MNLISTSLSLTAMTRMPLVPVARTLLKAPIQSLSVAQARISLIVPAVIATVLSLFVFQGAALGEVVETRISHISPPNPQNPDFEVLAEADGAAYLLPTTEPALLRSLRQKMGEGKTVTLVLDEERIIAVEAVSELATADAQVERPRLASLREAHSDGYEPTLLPTLEEAQRHFRSARSLKHKSQCFERAHVWAREMEQEFGTRSMKVFMFFTSAFRNRYQRQTFWGLRPYKWWFHVAPFVYTGSVDSLQETVLDPEFLDQAVALEDWTFEFIGKVRHDTRRPNPSRDQARCLEASHYNEYWRAPTTPYYCVLRKVPMYDFQPLDVEARDCNPLRENANGRPNRFLPDGRPEFPCWHNVLTAWRPRDLTQAYRNTRN